MAAHASCSPVHTTANAAAVMDAPWASPFDRLLLAHRLPDCAGTDALRSIRCFFPSTLVIHMTWVASREVAIRRRRGGARDSIRKPFDSRELQARMAALLDIGPTGIELRQDPHVQQPDPGRPGTLPDPEPANRGRRILNALRHTDVHPNATLSLTAVPDVSRELGFKDVTHFRRALKRLEGQIPSEFQRRGGGEDPGIHPCMPRLDP